MSNLRTPPLYACDDYSGHTIAAANMMDEDELPFLPFADVTTTTAAAAADIHPSPLNTRMTTSAATTPPPPVASASAAAARPAATHTDPVSSPFSSADMSECPLCFTLVDSSALAIHAAACFDAQCASQTQTTRSSAAHSNSAQKRSRSPLVSERKSRNNATEAVAAAAEEEENEVAVVSSSAKRRRPNTTTATSAAAVIVHSPIDLVDSPPAAASSPLSPAAAATTSIQAVAVSLTVTETKQSEMKDVTAPPAPAVDAAVPPASTHSSSSSAAASASPMPVMRTLSAEEQQRAGDIQDRAMQLCERVIQLATEGKRDEVVSALSQMSPLLQQAKDTYAATIDRLSAHAAHLQKMMDRQTADFVTERLKLEAQVRERKHASDEELSRIRIEALQEHDKEVMRLRKERENEEQQWLTERLKVEEEKTAAEVQLAAAKAEAAEISRKLSELGTNQATLLEGEAKAIETGEGELQRIMIEKRSDFTGATPQEFQ